MDNLKNFVVSKGLEVADSINTGYIILNGKAVSGLVDSSNVLGLIDSAYISSKSSGVDSSATIALIDSSYVQARESISISSFNTIAVAGQTDIVADSIGLSWRTSTEQAKLISSDFATNDGFARFVDLAGDYAIVSASSYDESPYENNGAAFIFKRTDSAGGTGWAQQAKLVRDSSSHSQSFSWSVSLNESATSALISNGGSSYAITEYTRDSANSTTWAQGQKILPAAGVTPTNTADWARNGAFDRKGNYFVVGADNDYGNGSSSTRYGSAWVYNKNSSGSQWALQQELVPSDDSDGAGTKGYGYAVSMATDSLIVVGADRYDGYTGAVYIFERAGSTWTQTQRLVGQASAASYFGKNVSMDGEYLAVSAPVMTTGTGIVYIYKNLGGTWTFQTSVQASDASTGKYFGNGLALKGSQLLVSAYAANTVYVFQKYGETWLEIKKIVGSSLSDGNTNGKLGGDLPGGLRINKSATDIDFLMGSTNKGAYVFTVPTATGPSNTLTLEAGSGISITTNATTDTVTIAGSAAGLDSAGVTSLIDSAYVQTRQTKYTNADFTDSAYVTTQINSVIDAAPGALDTLNELAAALGDDANFSTTITNQIAGKLDSAATTSLIDSAYVQARAPAGGNDSATTIALVDSSYVQARQITPISAFNTITVATQNNVVADSAAISYENTAQQAILQASNRGANDNFGSRVAIDNGYAIVTASSEDTGGSEAGSCYVYVRSGTTWTQQQQITSPISPPDGHYFGTDVDMEGSRVVIGSKYDDTDYNHGGGVHVYTRSGTTWSLEQRLASTDIAANDWFGDRVAISGNYIVASAHKKNSSEGAVYVFKGATSTTLNGSSYDSVQSVSLNAIESQPKSMLFNSDGTKVFIVGMSADAIKEYSLATPYDISTNFLSNASSSYSLTISGENNMGVYAMRWNSDGTKVYVLCNNNMKIYQHNLTTAYDISTASYSNKNFSSTTQENNYTGFTFNNDGTSMYLCGSQNSKVFQYTLSTAYDISTASYASKSFTPQGSHGGTKGIQFDESGKKLFILGNSLRQHDLATAFDVSSSITVSYAINILTNATQAGDFTFNADMSKLYAVEPGADKIFQFSTSGALTVWAQQAKLLASDNTTGDKFGFDVDIDGDTIAIGAAVADTGGKVYAFTRSGTTWSQQAAFTSSDISSEDEFGGSVSISSDTILVGAYKVDGSGDVPHGAAYAFTRSGTTWSQQAKIQPDDVGNDYGGTTAFAYRNVSLEGDVALVGWNRATFDGTAQTGAAYVFERSGTTWTQTKKLGASDATAADGFGGSTAIDDTDIIIGASGESSSKGQAYVFTA